MLSLEAEKERDRSPTLSGAFYLLDSKQYVYPIHKHAHVPLICIGHPRSPQGLMLSCSFSLPQDPPGPYCPDGPLVGSGPAQSPFLQKAIPGSPPLPRLWPCLSLLFLHLPLLLHPMVGREVHLQPLRASRVRPHQTLAFTYVAALRTSPTILGYLGHPACPNDAFLPNCRAHLPPTPDTCSAGVPFSRSSFIVPHKSEILKSKSRVIAFYLACILATIGAIIICIH